MMDYAEKRDFQRMAMDCSLQYKLSDSELVRQGQVINLSAKGILFIADGIIDLGSHVEIKLTPVNTITPPMSANTRVARCEDLGDGRFNIAAEIVQLL